MYENAHETIKSRKQKRNFTAITPSSNRISLLIAHFGVLLEIHTEQVRH